MHSPDKPRFIYRAGAYALGGQLTRPFSDVLEVQAATSLPTIGGYGSARSGKYRHRELVSFENAYSQVTGSSRGGVHDTLATVTVEGLNIMDMVTADRVVARLTSAERSADEPVEAASLLPIGSYFVNLRIAGVPVSPRPHDALLRHGKLSDLEHEYRAQDSPFVDPDGRCFRFPERKAAAAEAREGAHFPRFEDCYLLTSIFAGLDVKHAPFAISPGGAIQIEGFGRIVLGEYLISRNSRRLTMVVCHLGCPIEGTLGAGGVEGNGSGY